MSFVYIYQGDLLCEACGNHCRAELDIRGKTPDDLADENYDSDDYPKGPYSNGGGEADTPQHCGNSKCAVLLGNPLTADGRRYVAEVLAASNERHKVIARKMTGADEDEPARTWRQFYEDTL